MAKSEAFHEVARVLLEQAPDHLNKIIAAELNKIDTEAAAIRAEDADKPPSEKRRPENELSDRVSRFKSSVAMARAETIAAVDAEIERARVDWQKNRDRRPDRELAEIRRAENKFKGMTDEQTRELAINYANGETTLTVPELNELRARLRSAEALAELDGVNDTAAATNAEKPWITSSKDIAELAEYAAKLSTLKGDQVLFRDPNSPTDVVVSASELVDYTGVLESVAV